MKAKSVIARAAAQLLGNTVFHRKLCELLTGYQFILACAYLDDLIIYSKDWSSHEQHLRLILNQILQSGLCLWPDKCKIAQPEIKYLGMILSKDRIKLDPVKLAVIENAKTTNFGQTSQWVSCLPLTILILTCLLAVGPILDFWITMATFRPTQVSSYMTTPSKIYCKHTILNIQNRNEELCFLWSILVPYIMSKSIAIILIHKQALSTWTEHNYLIHSADLMEHRGEWVVS